MTTRVSDAMPAAIGRYKIESILGRGAMGVVYKGYDEGIDRQVAIKTVRRDLLSGDEAEGWLNRFRREAQAAGRCLHPNIVAVFEYGEHEGSPFIAMEFVQGRELLDVTRGDALLEQSVSLHVIKQVLEALKFAHAQGVVHRDIKPANIFLLEGGKVKVTDFGIARIDSTSMTQHGSIVGTPSYMSPEQFTGEGIDARTDIFSTGVVLFELLTGQKPFPGRSATEIMYRLLNHDPRPLMEINPQAPAALNAVCLKALSRDVAHRFQSAGEFADALNEAAEGETASAEDVDRTVFAAAAQAPKPAAAVSPLANADMTKIEKSLAYHIGPVAKIMVQQAARQSQTVSELYEALARNIPDPVARDQFLLQGRSAVGHTLATPPAAASAIAPRIAQPAVSLTPEHLEQVQRELLVYLGPIAKVMVRRAAAKATSMQALCEEVAANIPSAAEKTVFLRRVRALY